MEYRDLTRQQIMNWFSTRGGGGVEPEITAYTSGLTTPLSSGQTTLLNTFVKDLKSGLGISALSEAFDDMLILANETAESSLRNLVKRLTDATAVNSPTFTTLEGFTGIPATNSYIETNYNPNDDGVNAKLNDISVGAYIRNVGTETAGTIWGAFGTAHLVKLINIPGQRVNSTSSKGGGTGSLAGMIAQSRAISSGWNIYENDLSDSTGANSTALANVDLFLHAVNDNGTILSTNKSDAQLSFFWVGKSFTQTEFGVIRDTFEAYMDANNRGVIS